MWWNNFLKEKSLLEDRDTIYSIIDEFYNQLKADKENSTARVYRAELTNRGQDAIVFLETSKSNSYGDGEGFKIAKILNEDSQYIIICSQDRFGHIYEVSHIKRPLLFNKKDFDDRVNKIYRMYNLLKHDMEVLPTEQEAFMNKIGKVLPGFVNKQFENSVFEEDK